MGPFWPLGWHLFIQLQNWITWGDYLKTIHLLIETDAITKTGTLAGTFHKPDGEKICMSRLEYGPLTIFYYTWEQVSG